MLFVFDFLRNRNFLSLGVSQRSVSFRISILVFLRATYRNRADSVMHLMRHVSFSDLPGVSIGGEDFPWCSDYDTQPDVVQPVYEAGSPLLVRLICFTTDGDGSVFCFVFCSAQSIWFLESVLLSER